MPSSPGLLDLLTEGRVDVADALVKTNIDKLTVLPAGSRHRRATELLASEQMASLLRELATRYRDRIVIFDSPPLLATTEARVLATHMGQIIVVVAANATSQRAVDQALATIENCEIVLMMLNKVTTSEVGSYYGLYRGCGSAVAERYSAGGLLSVRAAGKAGGHRVRRGRPAARPDRPRWRRPGVSCRRSGSTRRSRTTST